MPFIVFLFFIYISPVYSADVLAPIEVTAQKEVNTFSFSESIIIDPTELQSGSSLLSEKIEQKSGIISTQNGGPGGRVSYFIRGTESRHTSFTLDGLKLNDPSNPDRQFDAAFITSPFLNEVSIHKGPQAVLFGSDAIGGIIELTTRKGENAPEGRISFSAGSFGTLEGSVSKDWQGRSSSGTVTAVHFHTDGISRLNKKRFDAKERDGSDITQLVSSSAHRWAPKIQTDFLASFVRGRNELDGAVDDNSHDESSNDQYLIQQKSLVEISKTQAFSHRIGINRHQRSIDNLVTGEESYGGHLSQHEILHRYKGSSFDFLSGLSTEHEEFSQSENSFDLNSAFIQNSFTSGNFGFQIGGRGEKHTEYGSFQTGSAGLLYKWDAQQMSLQYSRGFKSPSLYQLYGPPIFGFPVGNPELEPEINHSWDLSYRAYKENWEGGLSFFQNRLSNLITYTNDGFINQRKFISEGIEISAKYRTIPFEMSGSLTHQNFRRSDGEVLRRPENAVLLGLALFPSETTELSFRTRWFSSRKDLDENRKVIKLSPYELLNIGFRKMHKHHEWGVEVKNILNREYEELYGYSVMPRSVFGHIGIWF